ncbi:predicted protein [Sclerotinia sclerotiorum 1980 UF-70]|uniref:Uncharacterized protein n=1 Tax=Sclerotinia sclerotiorum (strain ATCC 18683 / 1980 / Ss-1) TaxID=665079 RepID=A7EH11_SCLS1|nr:predicted protein [Sclerotinia sclerotiorum 1980 UF-70]EDO02127.1 predicted protein [Sclerotinia sclerotiorum 1980 UF-70]
MFRMLRKFMQAGRFATAQILVKAGTEMLKAGVASTFSGGKVEEGKKKASRPNITIIIYSGLLVDD